MDSLKSYTTSLPELGLDRAQAFSKFEKAGIPTRKNEDWKYLSLKELSSKKLSLANEPDATDVAALNGRASASFTESPEACLLFSNGEFLPGRSSEAQGKVTATCLTQSDQKVREKLGGLSKDGECSFTSLNDALFTNAAVVHVPAGAKLESCIEVIFAGSKLSGTDVITNRLLVVAEEGAEVEIVERNVSPEGAEHTVLGVAEIFCAKGASVKHHRVQQEASGVTSINSVYIQQHEESETASNTFSFGGKIARNQIFPVLSGEFCKNYMRGVTLTGESQIIDTHTVIDHAVPNCESCEEFKTICGDKSQANFAGTIIVRQDAQKTNAIQSNDSLLISDASKSYSRPQLKIWADDVRCTHGATIGELDQDSLFYLRSRGIPLKDARKMLIEAFSSSVLEDIESPEVESKLREIILSRLAQLI